MKTYPKILIICFCILVIGCKEKSKTSIPEYGSYTDIRDTQTYKTVKIGSQVWMAKNLNYETDSGSWAYNHEDSIAEIYGRLYNWETACEICPKGWHLPKDTEWAILIDYLGGEKIAGGKLKETGPIHWGELTRTTTNSKSRIKKVKSSLDDVTNESGFTALPGGFCYYMIFYDIGSQGRWWSSSENSPSDAWSRILDSNNSRVSRSSNKKEDGMSVRCIKD